MWNMSPTQQGKLENAACCDTHACTRPFFI